MSWGAGRKTTRVEDVAYCMLGIFQVNMPMLYGEGERAFQRLQEEIMKEVNDYSIFAWRAHAEPESKSSSTTSQAYHYRGALANSPDEFVHAASMCLTKDPNELDGFTVTNKGISATAYIITSKHCMFMPLGFYYNHNHNNSQEVEGEEQLGILLKFQNGGQNLYARYQPEILKAVVNNKHYREIQEVYQ